ncbi:MAG TPA: hypothetical protein VGQ37_07115 [Vicinamibacterales bacterium]|jgi:hypothetical protein|nr:hypothetical protein [Vicinamibacterales bacterium]
MSLSESEFTALRATIASRGTARMVLVPVVVVCWASLAIVVVLFGDLPVAALPPLAVLVGGFEAINALHVGVERIGRYLQVFYEGPAGTPAWETTAMAVAPRVRGSGADPLFTVVFAAATILNLTTALVPEPTPLETLIIGGFHAAFLLRIARARQLAGSQRARDLRAFEDVRNPSNPRTSEIP